MNELVHEWIRKAEADFRTAEREVVVTQDPNWDAVCFHAQQAVEKYLKANLQLWNIPFEKTHDLTILLDLAVRKAARWEQMRADMRWLSFFAVRIRYPGEEAAMDDARRAVEIMRRWRFPLCESLPGTIASSRPVDRRPWDQGSERK